jgi:hypothetical protein
MSANRSRELAHSRAHHADSAHSEPLIQCARERIRDDILPQRRPHEIYFDVSARYEASARIMICNKKNQIFSFASSLDVSFMLKQV